jgi:hypothetical protein
MRPFSFTTIHAHQNQPLDPQNHPKNLTRRATLEANRKPCARLHLRPTDSASAHPPPPRFRHTVFLTQIAKPRPKTGKTSRHPPARKTTSSFYTCKMKNAGCVKTPSHAAKKWVRSFKNANFASTRDAHTTSNPAACPIRVHRRQRFTPTPHPSRR